MTANMTTGGGSGLAGDRELFRQALSNNWPISPEIKKMYMDLAATIAAHGQVKDKSGDIQKATVRDRLSAIKVTMLAERLDLLKIQAAMRAQMNEFHAIHLHKHDHQHDHHHEETGVRILEVDDWYENNDRIIAQTDGPSSQDPQKPSEVQGSQLRATVGKNGNGSHRNGKGPRKKKK